MDWFEAICIFVLYGDLICMLAAEFVLLSMQKKKRELLDEVTKKSDDEI